LTLTALWRTPSRLADFDVLCLQEVLAGDPDLPGYTALSGVAKDTPGPNGARRAFGNLRLSRFPVPQVFRHLLPWPADVGVRGMQCIALEATPDTPLGLVRVTTTHLEYYSRLQRAAQVERLHELHQEAVAHADSPCPDDASEGPFCFVPRAAASLLVGDFNCRPEVAEISRLLAAIEEGAPLYQDAWALVHPVQPHAPTTGLYDKRQWPGPPFACNFIFVSQNLAPRVQSMRVDATRDASDHQPLLIELA
jgi:endonuclease/exonuclease/phosphatase family metal-dependent hydrolase